MTAANSETNATSRSKSKIERLEARVSKEQKELFQRAADLEGLSLTDFVIGRVTEAAKRTIQEHETMVLSVPDKEAFVEALLNSPEPSDKLRAAARRYKQFLNK